MSNKRTYGEGSIYFNPEMGRWVAQIRLPNGKRRGKSAKTKGEASEWLLVQRAALRDGINVEDTHIAFGTFLERYMTDVAAFRLRPTTLRGHWSLINNHIKPELGRIRLADLRPDHVQRFYTLKLKEGLARSYVKYAHAIIRKALNQALKWGLVARNVATLTEIPSAKRKPPTIWNAYQVQKFLAEVREHQWYPIYVLAIYTGMRQGEILGVHREDVDLAKGMIHVKHALQYIPGEGLSITEPKTDRGKRPVSLPATALAALKEHMALQEENRQLIFATRTGKPISARNVVRHFKLTVEELGLPNIRFHDLRHTHASLLLAAGVHPKVVQERLGHSQISLTLDTYSHVVPSLQEEAAEKAEEILAAK